MTFTHDRSARQTHIQLCCGFLACTTLIVAAKADELSTNLSEREFLTDIPLVYSASRLPQLPQDAAGAISIIDREMIRASGARDITDLFRFVPGFQVGTSSGGQPVVSYHGLSGQISQRMQVYVDGRSLYAPYLFGGVDWTALSVPLDEIERIEIQRGANSVTYGANAFLGVIHIITRAAAQSVGFHTQLTQGNAGIADRHVRWGYSTSNAQWRMSAGTKTDDGLNNRLDAFSTNYFDFRAEIQPSLTTELSLFAGMTQSKLGIGFNATAVDPPRGEKIESSFFHARYKSVIDSGQEWSVAFSSTRDEGNDSFSIPLLNADTIPVDNNRHAQRYALSYQHFKDLNPSLRASWGLEYNTDELIAKQLFNTEQPQTNDDWHAYINQEWKPSPFWTLNLGGLVERNGLTTRQFAPRISLNWKPSAENTLKLGYSSAFRTPSLFEQRANWRTEYQGRTVDIRYLSTGNLIPEQVKALDLVYFGQWQKQGLTLDARLFREEISQLIMAELYLLPFDQANTQNAVAYDLRNNASVTNTGLEYQLSWRPKLGTMLVWSQNFSNPSSANSFVQSSIPRSSGSLLLSHTWSGGMITGLSYTETAPLIWLGESTPANRQRLVSLRLARTIRISDTPIELSAVWRQPVGQYDEFREFQSIPKQFWVNFRIEY